MGIHHERELIPELVLNYFITKFIEFHFPKFIIVLL
jgi:hypothetical protein